MTMTPGGVREGTDHARESTPDSFRSFMSGFPSGVAIITATDRQGSPWGMTCSALCSATTDPPTLIVGIRAESPTLKALLESRAFAVNLLHERARNTAELFASGAPDRFDEVRWESRPGYGGPHLLDDAHAVADCRVSDSVLVGRQRIVFGEPFHIYDLAETEPLLYGLRRYSRWAVDF
ncbi:flavin reductase family protein [Sphaerisporangium perillae]|uniref:flavin reductase family protein n=1 Tax=Sphaerisporangium perillae TaxID=2935860 RepID=UPI00200D2523|nr:flavin reductase family protein [Sphaerisporangium perillae]